MLTSVVKFSVLGVVQGLTEFFPVSSSGHLGLAELLLGVELGADQGAMVEVALHAGTLLAVLVFLRRDIRQLLRNLVARSGADPEEARRSRRLALLIMLASLPAACIGLGFTKFVEQLYRLPWLIGCGFLATGLMLVLSRHLVRGTQTAPEITPVRALAIGCAQALALVPGISRSGTTIVAALAFGVSAPEAGRFSFLMAIPVIGGATLLKSREILATGSDQLAALGVGVAASFFSGLLALRFLTALLRRGRLAAFAFYLIPIGFLALYVALVR